MNTNPHMRRESAHPARGLAVALAATLVLLIAGPARATAPNGAAPGSPPSMASRASAPSAPSAGRPSGLRPVVSTSGYSTRTLLAAAEADLAAGRPGQALVELERARLLAPRSSVVAGQLAHAREVANLEPIRTSPFMRAARLLSGRDWSWVALCGLVAGAAGVILLSWGAAGGPAGNKRAAGLVVAGLAVAALGLGAAVKVTPSRGDAVVVAAGATARIAPFAGAEPAFSLQEGAPVRVARAHGEYVLVEAGQGPGWLPRNSVETILPGSLIGLEHQR